MLKTRSCILTGADDCDRWGQLRCYWHSATRSSRHIPILPAYASRSKTIKPLAGTTAVSEPFELVRTPPQFP